MNSQIQRRTVLALGLAPFAASARNAAFPSQAIKLVVPFAASGFIDVVARALSDKLATALGQPVVVENKAGAGGNIGTGFVANAAPDGHTLLVGFDGTLVINPFIYPNTGFDTRRDFAPILKLADSSLVLVGHPGLGVKDLRELLARAKARPDQPWPYATSGVGSTPHVTGALLAQRTGMRLLHVPYKGGGAAVTDAVAGQVPLCITVLATAAPHLKSGRLVALASGGATRMKALPDVPTFQESGLAGLTASSWVGMFAPARTPTEVLQRLHKEFFLALSKPDIRERFDALGLDAVGNSPLEFAAQIRADLDRYGQVVKAARISVDS